MRTVTALVLAVVLTLGAPSRAGNSNQSINIAGVLRDSAGNLQSTAVTLTVSLYGSAQAASPFFMQTFAAVPVESGFFTVELSGAALSLAGVPDAWVGVQVMGDPAELPRQHLDAAPYALSAVVADSLSAACSGCVSDAMIAGVAASKVSGKVAQCASADTAQSAQSAATATSATTAQSATTAATADALSSSCSGCVDAPQIKAGALTHSHGLTVSLGAMTSGAGGGVAKAFKCQNCPAGSVVVGGTCTLNGTVAGVFLQEQQALPGFGYCCTYAGDASAPASYTFFVTPTCLSVPTSAQALP
jgi:hypothetical protein